MTFFDKKEEVIEIKLTSFGKSLYSRGKLKPSYYAFYDEDVIYDSLYGCSSGSADQRIGETPRSRVQTSRTGVDNNLEKIDTFYENFIASGIAPSDAKEINLVEEARRRDIFLPIGSSANSTPYYPAWRSYLLLGNSDSTKPYFYFGNETGSVVNIPQIDIKKRVFTSKAIRGSDDNTALYGYVFPDGSSLTLKENENAEFLLYLEEKNASSDNKNFSVEVYEMTEENGKEMLYPLKFKKGAQTNRIVDGIMLDSDPEIGTPPPPADPTEMVDYYFDVELDEEISVDILRRAFQSGRFAGIEDLESLVSTFRFPPGTDATSGGPSSEIYGLSLDDIAQMDSEIIEGMETGLYDEDDNSDDDDC